MGDQRLLAIQDEIAINVNGYASIEVNSEAAGDTAEEFALCWRARGLVDYHHDSRRIMTYQRVKQLNESNPSTVSLQANKTDLYEKLPLTTALIEELTTRAIKSRLFLLKARSTLPWHTH
ncbi:MAG: hypothetical protein RBT63_11625, partial [Bdellovibrionales bacterium]|nr:hypothetical protein [Bdellovibrionales bacterium]